jgi:acyl dehydratase
MTFPYDAVGWSLDVPTITHGVLSNYAVASGDGNPVHVDPAAARAAGEADVIAHGMLTMAYLGRLATTLLPQDDLVSWRVRFVAKTPVGARLFCRAVLTQRSMDLVHVALTAHIDDGTVTARGDAVYRCSEPDRADPSGDPPRGN